MCRAVTLWAEAQDFLVDRRKRRLSGLTSLYLCASVPLWLNFFLTQGYPMTTPRDPLTDRVLGCAIEVHRTLGPGLLESAYEECLCYELALAGIACQRQMPLPVR
mgnify:CR=1 FL=1